MQALTPTDVRSLLARLLGDIAPEVDLDDASPKGTCRRNWASTRWTS